MAKTGKDWFPHTEEGMLELIEKWKEVLPVQAKQTAYAWPADECAAVVQSMDGFKTAKDNYVELDSSENLVIKNERKKTAEESMRDFAAAYIRPNKRVPLEEKIYLGVPPRDEHSTPVGKPEYEAPFSMAHGAFMQVIIRHGAKPYGMNGAIFRYAILPADAPAPLYDQLTESRLLTKPVEYLDFPDSLKGRILYGALSWQSNAGEKGPPSEVISIVLG